MSDAYIEDTSAAGARDGERVASTRVEAGWSAGNREGAHLGTLEIGVQPATDAQEQIADLQAEVERLRVRASELESELADLHLFINSAD